MQEAHTVGNHMISLQITEDIRECQDVQPLHVHEVRMDHGQRAAEERSGPVYPATGEDHSQVL